MSGQWSVVSPLSRPIGREPLTTDYRPLTTNLQVVSDFAVLVHVESAGLGLFIYPQAAD